MWESDVKKLDLYDFKTALFDNGNPEDFLLFISSVITTLKASGTLAANAKIK